MKIRPATIEDSAVLAQIHLDSWNTAYRGLVPDSTLDDFDLQKRKDRFEMTFNRDDEGTYLVESDEGPAGFLSLGECRCEDVDRKVTGELLGIYLDPKFWRKGIGSFTFKHAEEILLSKGYTEFVLWVFRDNALARSFYEAMGCKPDGTTKILELGAALMAVRYRKSLGKGA